MTRPDDAEFNAEYLKRQDAARQAEIELGRGDRLADRAGLASDRMNSLQDTTSMLPQDAQAFAESDPGNIIAKISRFEENCEIVLKALAVVKEAHPFINVIVSVFETAIRLELGRRKAERNVRLLQLDMMQMMETLVDLRTIQDSDKKNPDGTTIKERMEKILAAAIKDIRDCSATCEEYNNKKGIVKFFDNARWNRRLADFSGTFAQRKAEFSAALDINLTFAVGRIEVTLASITSGIQAENSNTAMLLLFQQLERPAMRSLQKLIADKGGPLAVINDSKLFDQVQMQMKEIQKDSDDKNLTKRESADMLIITLRNELQEDLGASKVEQEKLNVKFDAFQSQLQEMKNLLPHTHDHKAPGNAGGRPQDQLRDKDLFAIWNQNVGSIA
ncbi:Ubiquitin family protein [Mycena chlorophos]|uniref:Ubiquitin family protein n=1 Tax=Mycena chlorophos TaxID=658473 RepID=A0A8H6S5L7_MYCCL|nr:Ubiquitin family protein [Mycena chlorophos]